MGRVKPAKNPRGGFVQLHWSLMDSPSWQALDFSEHSLWLAVRRDLKGSNNGNIAATLGTLKHRGFKSSATLAKGLRALTAAGFIAKTRQGGIAYGSKVCCLYRFTDEAVLDMPKHGIKSMPPSNEWQRFTTLEAAREAIELAHAQAKRPANKTRQAFRK